MMEMPEGDLVLSFPDDWTVIKFDEDSGFAARKITIPGTKRVDVLALAGSKLIMFELKDFRGYRIENKRRLENSVDKTGPEIEDPIHIEVAKKFRDSLAALLAAHRGQDEDLSPFCQQLFKATPCELEVVLLMEQDEAAASSPTRRHKRQNIEQGLARFLRPFKVKCHVQRKATLPADSPWTIRYAPAVKRAAGAQGTYVPPSSSDVADPTASRRRKT